MDAKIYQTAIFLTMLLMLAGCHKSNVALNAPQTASPQPIPLDTLVTLERTGCYGSCPSYSITISADGAVLFDGKAFVKTTGRADGRITRDQLSQLITTFNRADYFSLNDRYGGAADGCPENWTDQASAITSFRFNGQSKKIAHDYGCRELRADHNLGDVWPQALFQVEKQIDQIVDSDRWVK